MLLRYSEKLTKELDVVLIQYFFYNDTATTEIYTLSLHDALPISANSSTCWPSWTRTPSWTGVPSSARFSWAQSRTQTSNPDRKSTRLNSSHANISYAVFCLKKKNLL